MTSTMRQFAPTVLAVWLASWAIVTMQPCCESILQSSQSHHGTQESGHHTDNHSDHKVAADTNHHNPAHDCRVALENLDDLSVPVTDTYMAKYELQPDEGSIIPSAGLLAMADNTLISYVYHFTHPPPGNNQLYLTTLRIRV